VEFPIQIKFVTFQDYQTRQLITEEGNLTGPIRTHRYVHAHTSNTRQPESQLKSSSCSSAIPNHNSRDAIPSHNPRNTTCLTPIPSHNSREMFRATTQGTPASRPLRYPRSLVDHANHTSKTWFCCNNIAWCYSRGAKHFPLLDRLEGVMSSNLCPHKCLNFGDLISFLRLRIDFSYIIYYWIFLSLIMQLKFNLGP